MTKRTEPATPAVIAYWNLHSATLTQKELESTIRQLLKYNAEAMRDGDDVAEAYTRVKVLTYSGEWTKRYA